MNLKRIFLPLFSLIIGYGIILAVPAKAYAAQVTNICGMTPSDGMKGHSSCEGPCWSDTGSEGSCTDPTIAGSDTFIDIQACDSDAGDHDICDSSTGGYGLYPNYNGGSDISSSSYIGSHCKIQFDTYKDDGSGRNLIGFLTVREPANCGGPPPTNPPEPTNPPQATSTPAPQCGQTCSTSDECPQVCPNCTGGTCQAAPSATPAPQCGQTCSTSDECPQVCPNCTGGTCQAAPTATPAPACGQACTPGTTICPQDCPVCVTTGGGSVCIAPSPTPTIVATCKCDGMTYNGPLTNDQWVTFTAYAKVENPDTNNAKVLNMVYHVLINGVEDTNQMSGVLTASDPVRTTENGISIDKYSTSWDYHIPGTSPGPASDVQYTIRVQINCGYKSASGIEYTACSNSNLVSLTKTIESHASILANNLQKFFTFKGFTLQTPVFAVSSDAEPTIPPSLHLGTFYPTINLDIGCTYISFKIRYGGM